MASYRCARCLSDAQGKSIVNGRLAEPVSGAMKKAMDNWEKLRPSVWYYSWPSVWAGICRPGRIRLFSACIRLACGRSRSSTDDNAKAQWL